MTASPELCRVRPTIGRLALAALLMALAAISAGGYEFGGAAAVLNSPTALSVKLILDTVGMPALLEGTTLLHPAGFGIRVEAACTPTVLLLAVAAGLLALPLTRAEAIYGLILSSPALWWLNSLRLAGLYYTGVYSPGHFAAVHDWVGPMLMIAGALAFLFWWSRPATSRLPGPRAKIGAVALSSALLVSCSTASDASPADSGSNPEFISQVIVKFESDAEIDADIRASMNDSDTPSAAVMQFANGLSREIGIPFEATKITSGRELLVEVRSESLLLDLQERLSQLPEIAASSRTGGGPSSPYRRDEIAVKFKTGTESYRALASIDPASGAGPVVARIAATVTRDVAYPVSSRVLTAGELLLSIDATELTQRLVTELRKRSDVSYAQANYVMQHY